MREHRFDILNFFEKLPFNVTQVFIALLIAKPVNPGLIRVRL